jgi:hypothetical protein
MPFFLDGNPTQGEISEAVNYLLGNTQLTTSTNIVNGQVTDASGTIVSYLYKYLYVKYADSFDGSVNFSNTPTGRSYYGLRNNDSSTESTNPADYIWYQVAGGFGTTKFVFYSVTGGRRINIVVGLSAPSILYQADSGAAIDLDRVSGSDGSSSRICYAKSTSFALASTPTTYQTSGPSGFPPTNTWGGAETWQATPPALATNEALFQSDGIYNPVTDLTTWNVPYLSNLKVGALSAISADLGTITAGDLSVGSSPVISGSSMTGTGAHIYSNGRMVVGNTSNNMVFDGTTLTINGNIVTYGNLNGTAVGQIIAGSFNFVSFTSSSTFTVPANVYKLKVTVVGGGGGGGRTAYTNVGGGGGGGSGGGSIKVFAVTPGWVFTVTVGNGGAGGTSGAGSAGQDSVFTGNGFTITGNGGSGGSAAVATGGAGGNGGSASGGDLNLQGGSGSYGTPQDSGAFTAGSGGSGGSAPFIGTSAGANKAASSNSGGGGGGGGNVNSAANGAAGGSGVIFVEY